MTTTPDAELRAAITLLRTAPFTGARTMTAATAALLRAREPIADWLDSWTGVDLSEHGPMPEDARHALAVARQILGTTHTEDTATEPAPEDDVAELRAELAKVLRWHKEDGTQLAKMRTTIERLRAERTELIRQRDQIAMDTIKALPTTVDRATVLREGADLIEQALIHSVAPAASKRDQVWDQAVRAAATELRDVADGAQQTSTGVTEEPGR
ncbi:hypothetical protein [Streptomyces sp. NPDC006971]|uniref:hypothetical protein n=1 Tax=Streptomyces sp. NPDC006971 TaxID=3154784 RepID=UPI0033DB1CA2